MRNPRPHGAGRQTVPPPPGAPRALLVSLSGTALGATTQAGVSGPGGSKEQGRAGGRQFSGGNQRGSAACREEGPQVGLEGGEGEWLAEA